jgi:hypothetical protein
MTPEDKSLTGTGESDTYGTFTPPRPQGSAVLHFSTYDWRKDAIDSFHLALHFKALALGHKRPSTPAQQYWVEQHGSIP